MTTLVLFIAILIATSMLLMKKREKVEYYDTDLLLRDVALYMKRNRPRIALDYSFRANKRLDDIEN